MATQVDPKEYFDVFLGHESGQIRLSEIRDRWPLSESMLCRAIVSAVEAGEIALYPYYDVVKIEIQ